jgi:inhibitor of cysteine peptidase
MIAIDSSANGQTVGLAVGETMEVRLAETAGTGFRWRLDKPLEPACRVTEELTVPPPAPARPGQPGQHVWRMVGVQVGTCTLAASYARPWETGVTPAAGFTLRITVTPA